MHLAHFGLDSAHHDIVVVTVLRLFAFGWQMPFTDDVRAQARHPMWEEQGDLCGRSKIPYVARARHRM